jgi:DNA-binding response OmpR family regulator
MADAKRKILIVEDEAPLRKALAEEFVDADYIVLEANDGLEGLTIALRDKPDIILLDQLMPKLNGVGMLKQLRSDPWGAKVPVIMATNMSTTDTINEAIDAGANDYFIKSEVSVAEIIKLIDDRLTSA